MILDVYTLYLVVAVLAVVMTGWVTVMAWGQPPGDALRVWSWALTAYAFSSVMFSLPGLLSVGATVVLGNAAYGSALALMLLALRRFQGAEVRRLSLVLPVLLALAVAIFWAHDFRHRIFGLALVYGGQLVLVLWALVDERYTLPARGRAMLMLALLGLILALLLRAFAAHWHWLHADSESDGSQWQAGLILAAAMAVLCFALGFVYMYLERAERRSFELAMHDPLTGLANRRAISDALHSSTARAHRQGLPFSLLLVDIDHFKRVNDSYGHQAGDEVLRVLARTLQSRLRAQDAVGRFGGEEFLVLLPDTDRDGALVVAQALREAVAQSPAQWAGRNIHVTVSIGVGGGKLAPQDSIDSLVAAADSALYAAKQGGRDRVEQAPG
jgi:diguanylate cyclase (GGDEF)-like protein